MPFPFISVICFREEGMIHFFYRSHAKKPESGLFSDWIRNYGWFALFRLAKMSPSVSCCRFQSAFLLAYKWAVNTPTSSLSNFCRLSFLEFEECLNRNFILWNIFHLMVSRFQSRIDNLNSEPVCRLCNLACSRYQKSCSQKFTDHLNAIWYRLQVTKATNGFTFK